VRRLLDAAGLACLLLTLPIPAASAQDVSSEGEKPEELLSFEDSVRELAPLRIEAGVKGYRIEIEVHRWGDPEQDFEAEIAIAAKPSFLGDVRVVEGSSLQIAAGETSAVVTIRFDAVDGASADGNETLQVSISPADEEFVPASRLLEIPFDLRTREDPLVLVYALSEDAPEQFPFQDAIDHVDAGVSDIMTCDQVAVFFTPARDLGEPLENKNFSWRIRRQSDGEDVAGGTFAFIGADGSALERLPFAKEGSPARFAVPLNPWRWGGDAEGTETFVLVTTRAKSINDGLLGATGDDRWIPASDGWQEEGTFELAVKRLHYLGFTFERVENSRLPKKTDGEEEKREWYGRLDMIEAKEGERVDLDLRVRAGEVDGRSRLTLHFPEELDPNGPAMGVVDVDGDGPEDYKEAQREFAGLPGATTVFTAAMRPLVALGELPDHPAELWGKDPPVAWGRIERDDRIAYWVQDVEQDQTMIHDGIGRLGRSGRFLAFEHTIELELERLEDTGIATGAPSRSLAGHLRDPGTRWLLPVVVHLAVVERLTPPWRAPSPYISAHGYAIYGAADGPAGGGTIAHAQSGTGDDSGGGPEEDAAQVEADAREAEATLAAAEIAAARAKALAEAGAISQADADAAEAARAAAEARVAAARGGAKPSEERAVSTAEEDAPPAEAEDPEAIPPDESAVAAAGEDAARAEVEPEEEVYHGWSAPHRLGPPMGTEYVSGKSFVRVDPETNTVRIKVSDWEYVGTWEDPPERIEPGEIFELALEMRAVTVGKQDRDTLLRVTSGGGVNWVQDMGTCRPKRDAPQVRTTAKIKGPTSDSYHELRIEVSARPWSGWTFPLATYVYARGGTGNQDETWVKPGQLRIPLPAQIGPYKRVGVATVGMRTGGWPGDGGFRTQTITYKSGKATALEFVLEWWQEGDGGGPDLCGAPWSELGSGSAEARSAKKQARVHIKLANPDDQLDWDALRPIAEDLLRMIERAALPCR